MIRISQCCNACIVYMLCMQNARVSVSGFFCQKFFFVLKAFFVFSVFAAISFEILKTHKLE
jgi:hypothetical protein